MDKNFWDDIYTRKSEEDVSWFQATPIKSLELLAELGLKPIDSVIDIGGGDSRLADHLLSKGFKDITILDISSVALNKARARLGDRAKLVKFVASDVTKFQPNKRYKLWHDRATFHFLTKVEDVEAYLKVASRSVKPGGYLIVSTFSKTGPEKCSGLPIVQYSDTDLKSLFAKYFSNIKCFEDTHITPWGANQNFVYCGFTKI